MSWESLMVYGSWCIILHFHGENPCSSHFIILWESKHHGASSIPPTTGLIHSNWPDYYGSYEIVLNHHVYWFIQPTIINIAHLMYAFTLALAHPCTSLAHPSPWIWGHAGTPHSNSHRVQQERPQHSSLWKVHCLDPRRPSLARLSHQLGGVEHLGIVASTYTVSRYYSHHGLQL